MLICCGTPQRVGLLRKGAGSPPGGLGGDSDTPSNASGGGCRSRSCPGAAGTPQIVVVAATNSAVECRPSSVAVSPESSSEGTLMLMKVGREAAYTPSLATVSPSPGEVML